MARPRVQLHLSRLLIGLVSICACRGALACSGPGAAEAIRTNHQAGLLSFGLVATIIIISLAIRRFAAASTRWYTLLLIVLHPYCYLSATSGDCGYLLRDTSLFFAGVALGVLAAAVKGWVDHSLGARSARQISLKSLLIISVAFGCAGALKLALLVEEASIVWPMLGFLSGIGLSIPWRARSVASREGG